MKRIFFGLILLLLFSGLVSAVENPLSDYGFNELHLTNIGEKKCENITVDLALTKENEFGAGVLSIKSSFGSKELDNTYVSVSINGGEEQIIWKEFFYCEKDVCWARVFVPELKNNKVSIEVCGVLGGNTDFLSIFDDSLIGVYDIPFLKIENNSPAQIFLGERAKMTIFVSNEGTQPADIFIQFIHPDTRAKVEISSFDIVEGESSATTLIKPNESKEFVYYIKPTLISSYNLPSAALFFRNGFGEEQVLLSNHPMLAVVKPKRIDLSLISVVEGESTKLKVLIKNNQSSSFEGEIIISPQTKLTEFRKSFFVSASGEQEVVFEVNNFEGESATFFATVVDEKEIFYSNSIVLENTTRDVPIGVYVSIIGFVLAILILVWIYFFKK